MDNRRKTLSFFKPPTRMTRILVEELKRCWAKLDNRAATIRRLQSVSDRLRRDRDRWREAAIDDLAEINRLEREQHRQRVKLKNRADFIIELWQGMQAARQWIRGEFRDGPLGDPAAKSWACLWCGEMLTGREHAKQHCEFCPESPLVQQIEKLQQYIADYATPPDDENAVS